MGTTFRLSTVGLLVSLLWVSPVPAADTLEDDFRYVPANATVVAGFEPWPGDDHVALFRDELLESTGLGQRLRALGDVLAGARRVLLYTIPQAPGGRPSLVCVVRGERPAASRDVATADIFIEQTDAGTWLVGERTGVVRALARHRDAGDSLTSALPVREAFLEAASGATAWAWLTPAGSACDSDACTRGDVTAAEGSFTRSVAGMEWWTVSLQTTQGSRLVMRTHLRAAEDAEVLADGLRGFLASRRLDARRDPEEIRLPLEQARVRAAGRMVHLDLPSTAPLLRRLCRKDGCEAPMRNLLTWRLGLEEREAGERIDEVLRRLRVGAGERVADVGAGLGFYTVRLAGLVGHEGQAIAVEIDEEMVAELRRRGAEGLPQMQAVLGAADDPRLSPESLDAVLIVNAYHEMPEHRRILGHIWRALRPGGRLMLVEPFAPDKRTESRDRSASTCWRLSSRSRICATPAFGFSNATKHS